MKGAPTKLKCSRDSSFTKDLLFFMCGAVDLRAAEFTAGPVLAETLGGNAVSLLWNLKQLQMPFSPANSLCFLCFFQLN